VSNLFILFLLWTIKIFHVWLLESLSSLISFLFCLSLTSLGVMLFFNFSVNPQLSSLNFIQNQIFVSRDSVFNEVQYCYKFLSTFLAFPIFRILFVGSMVVNFIKFFFQDLVKDIHVINGLMTILS